MLSIRDKHNFESIQIMLKAIKSIKHVNKLVLFVNDVPDIHEQENMNEILFSNDGLEILAIEILNLNNNFEKAFLF